MIAKTQHGGRPLSLIYVSLRSWVEGLKNPIGPGPNSRDSHHTTEEQLVSDSFSQHNKKFFIITFIHFIFTILEY